MSVTDAIGTKLDDTTVKGKECTVRADEDGAMPKLFPNGDVYWPLVETLTGT